MYPDCRMIKMMRGESHVEVGRSESPASEVSSSNTYTYTYLVVLCLLHTGTLS